MVTSANLTQQIYSSNVWISIPAKIQTRCCSFFQSKSAIIELKQSLWQFNQFNRLELKV